MWDSAATAAPGHGRYAAQKKGTRPERKSRRIRSAPPRLFLSLCPRQGNQRRGQAGCTPRLPRRCIHEVRRGGRTRPVTFSPPPHSRSMPRRARPPRHGCPAAASAVPDGVKRTKWKQMQRVTAETLRLPVAFCSRRAHWAARSKQRVPCLPRRRIHELHHGIRPAPPRLLCCRTRSALWMQPVFRLRKGCKTRHFFINTCKSRQGDV